MNQKRQNLNYCIWFWKIWDHRFAGEAVSAMSEPLNIPLWCYTHSFYSRARSWRHCGSSECTSAQNKSQVKSKHKWSEICDAPICMDTMKVIGLMIKAVEAIHTRLLSLWLYNYVAKYNQHSIRYADFFCEQMKSKIEITCFIAPKSHQWSDNNENETNYWGLRWAEAERLWSALSRTFTQETKNMHQPACRFAVRYYTYACMIIAAEDIFQDTIVNLILLWYRLHASQIFCYPTWLK
mgnify:CR=1 FL=1